MTKIRRVALTLLFVCAPVLAQTKPHAQAGIVPAAKAVAHPAIKTGDTLAPSGSRPPPGRSAQLLNHAAEVLSSGDMSRPVPVALALTIGVVLLLSFFLFSRERRLRLQRERLRKTYL